MRCFAGSLAVTLMLGGALAGAQPVPESRSVTTVRRARAHFESGAGFYLLGHYREALAEYAAAYQIDPRPEIIVDMALTHERLDEPALAKALYERFLKEAAPDDRLRPQVEGKLRELAASPVAVRAAPPVAERVIAQDATPVAVAPAPDRGVAHRRAVRRTLAWSIPLGLVVVGAGLGLGLYFGLRSSSTCTSRLGCSELPAL